jgi:hypothetical protein
MLDLTVWAVPAAYPRLAARLAYPRLAYPRVAYPRLACPNGEYPGKPLQTRLQ